MTKLDLVLARIKQLPPDQQEILASEIEFMLDHDPRDYALTPEQEAELARRLADPNREYVSHEDVREYFEKKFGR
jgi:putative addiction module component (TIGR02574 family)